MQQEKKLSARVSQECCLREYCQHFMIIRSARIGSTHGRDRFMNTPTPFRNNTQSIRGKCKKFKQNTRCMNIIMIAKMCDHINRQTLSRFVSSGALWMCVASQ